MLDARLEICSTPEGILVGFTPGGSRGRSGRGSAQRPKASWSGSLGSVWGVAGGVATAQRPKASWSGSRGKLGWVRMEWVCCSTPEGILVGFTRMIPRSSPQRSSAQRPKASWSGSRKRLKVIKSKKTCSTPEGILVGFTAVGRGHSIKRYCCSTPEGILVGFTQAVKVRRATRDLLNARRHLGRVHTWPPVIRPRCWSSAQRPKASWSGSRSRRTGCRWTARSAQRPKASWSGSRPHCSGSRWAGLLCSTPEGILVGFTSDLLQAIQIVMGLLNARRHLGRVHSPTPMRLETSTSAQRPKASWSGSRSCLPGAPRPSLLLNARRHLGRVHTSRRTRSGPTSTLLNARRHLGRVH